MYFKNRIEAGQKLADQLQKYRSQTCAVVALSDGGVIVGAQIAAKLRCVLMLLLMEPINLPGEPDPVAVMNQEGMFTYNNMYSTGQLEELSAEFFGYIEQQKIEKMHIINALLTPGGITRNDLLKDHTVVLVSDGLNNALSLDAAYDFLKPVRTSRLIIATPVASVNAVDRMHILTDEIYCLSVPGDFFDTNHYYDQNKMPDHEAIVKTIKGLVGHWHNSSQTKTQAKGNSVIS